MRAFLLLLLSAVAVIILWAIRSKSYENDLVFALSALAAGLCAYLLADYFFNMEKKALKQDITAAGKEIQALKDEKDLLQTQFNLATPHAQVEQLEQQLAFADEQRNKLDGLSRAQYAEISGLKTQLEMQKKNYQKLYEESAIATETRNAELMALQDTLASKREKIKYLTDESEYLRGKILKLQTAAEEETIQRVVAESNDPTTAILPKVVIKMPQNGANTEGYVQQDFAARTIDEQILDTEIVVETPAETIIDNKSSKIEAVIDNKSSEIEAIVDNNSSEIEEIIDNNSSEIEAVIDNNSSEIEEIIDNKSSEIEEIIDNKSSEIEEIVDIEEKTALDVYDEIVSQSRSLESVSENTATTVESSSISTSNSENLQAIQGIDAEIERVLKNAGIDNWQEISETSAERLNEILVEGKINNVDTSSWSVQSILLIDGHINRLKAYLENLKK